MVIVGMGVSRERAFQAEEIASVKAPSLLVLIRVWGLTSKGVKRKNTQRRPPRYLAVGIVELYLQ